jgi:hypothetical protein
MLYRVAHRYRSLYYSLEPGVVVDLDEETADYLLRDSPGLLEAVEDTPVLTWTTANRQVSAPGGRRKRSQSGG